MKIIVDLDGTLFDNTARAHLIPELHEQDSTAAWKPFNEACLIYDKPIPHVIAQVKALYWSILGPSKQLIFLTSRGADAEPQTKEQLVIHFPKHVFQRQRLIMRQMDCNHLPVEFKDRMLERIVKPEDDGIAILFDDHPGIIEMVKLNYPRIIAVQVDSYCSSLQK